MLDTYDGGYRKALLDIDNLLDSLGYIDSMCKSKAQYKTAIKSFLTMLLTSPEDFEKFKSGLFEFKWNPNTKEFIPSDKWKLKGDR